MIRKIVIFLALISVSAFAQNPTRGAKAKYDTLYVKNFKAKIGTLNDESATPNVSGAERWKIDYDTPTTITNLRGMASADTTRIVYFEIINETITFSDSLCPGGIGLYFTVGDFVKAQWKGNGWRITAEFLN